MSNLYRGGPLSGAPAWATSGEQGLALGMEPGGSGCKSRTSRWVCFVFLNLLMVLAEALQPRNSIEDTVSHLFPPTLNPHLTPQLECEWGDAFSVPLLGRGEREKQEWKTLEAF